MKVPCLNLALLILITIFVVPGSAVTGADWSAGNLSAEFPARSDHTTVVFNDRLWILGGTNGLTIRNDTWSSADGITWTLVNASAGFTGRSASASLVFNNRMWIIGGSGMSGSLNDTWSSTDGNIWTLVNASPEFPARSYHSAVVYNNRMWVIGGYTSHLVNDTWYSTDGNIWTLANASAEFPARDRQRSVVFLDKMWIIGGYDGNYLNDTWKSGDGALWTLVNGSAAFSGRSDHTATIFDGNIWITGGQNLLGSMNDSWYSAEGNIWASGNATAAFPARYSHTTGVLGNKMWLLGGADSSGYYNDTWYTEAAPVPVVTTPDGADSGSDTPAVQSSVKEVVHSGEAITFSFGKSLSAANPVRIESVTIIPQTTFSGEIRCIVREPETAGTSVPPGVNTAGFAEILVDWIRADAVQQGTVIFSLDRAWLDANNYVPADIVMLYSKNGQWEQLPTSFVREESGRVWFSAITPGFARFAVAAGRVILAPQQAVENPTPDGTISTVAPVEQEPDIPEQSVTAPALKAPAAASDTGTASDNPVQGNGFVYPLVFAAGIVLVGGGFLVRRWWIQRQNPALFRRYR